MGAFNFSAWPKFQDRPVVHPGKLFDRTDNDGISAVPQGGPAPYGRVLVVGIAGSNATNPDLNLGDRYFTKDDSVSLPDLNGAHLTDFDSGATYAASGLALPVDPNGDLIYAGIGIWTEHNSGLNGSLAQPFGLGEHCYQPERCGQIGMAQEGNIWAYCETDIDKGDDLFFRTVVTSTTDGLQLLGAFSNVGGAEFQAFPHGTVFRGGPAGGAFVVNLNVRK